MFPRAIRTVSRYLDLLGPMYRHHVPGQDPPGPASEEDLAGVEELFRSKGASGLPPELHELWSHTDGSALGAIVVWRVRRHPQRTWFEEGVLEANEILEGIPDGYVYIGRLGDEYLAYHLPTGRIDLMDFLGTARDGFPDVVTMLEVIVNMEGG